MATPPNLLAAVKGLKVEIDGIFVLLAPLLSLPNVTIGPTTVQSVADLKFTAIVTNTSDESLTLVNDPSGILSSSELPTKRYEVIHSSGAIPNFTGVMIKFSPKAAADGGAVIILAPGQSSITFDHDRESLQLHPLRCGLTCSSVGDIRFHSIGQRTIRIQAKKECLLC